ncbi:MAG: TonB-dependent receptor [Sphingomonadales bacterium]|nr:TonB-dependent receptor [Sphingomonadales bacterium]
MVKIILKCSAAIAALGCAPSSLWAQDTDEGCNASEDCIIIADQKRTDIVVTATGSFSLPENSGQTISLLDDGIIEQRQSASASDLIDSLPGVTVSRNGGIGKTTALRIRGAEGDQTLTLIDGVRANDPSSPGGGFDFGNLLIGNIQRIEVLRGPNSVHGAVRRLAVSSISLPPILPVKCAPAPNMAAMTASHWPGKAE